MSIFLELAVSVHGCSIVPGQSLTRTQWRRLRLPRAAASWRCTSRQPQFSSSAHWIMSTFPRAITVKQEMSSNLRAVELVYSLVLKLECSAMCSNTMSIFLRPLPKLHFSRDTERCRPVWLAYALVGPLKLFSTPSRKRPIVWVVVPPASSWSVLSIQEETPPLRRFCLCSLSARHSALFPEYRTEVGTSQVLFAFKALLKLDHTNQRTHYRIEQLFPKAHAHTDVCLLSKGQRRKTNNRSEQPQQS